ncbi:MAG: TolB family protein, partial [Planctomycetota bacterium]
KGQKEVAVIDGVESKEYDSVRNFTFSPDGKRVAFKAQKGQKKVAVIDGVESQEYDEVWNVTFSPDGKRVGFFARKGQKGVAVIDGVESQEYDRVENFTFSPDSKRVGFTARKNQKWVAVIDGVESQEYDRIMCEQNLFFCFVKGGKYAVAMGRNERLETSSSLIVDNKELVKLKVASGIKEYSEGFFFLGYTGTKLYQIKCK